jgi:hypothetical protein
MEENINISTVFLRAVELMATKAGAAKKIDT